jgi:hypothetical protein
MYIRDTIPRKVTMTEERKPPEGAVRVARDFLEKALIRAVPSQAGHGVTPSMLLEEFDTFVQDYGKVVGAITGARTLEGIRVAITYGFIVELLESVLATTNDTLESAEPFTTAGRILGAVSPERAEELLNSLGYELLGYIIEEPGPDSELN